MTIHDDSAIAGEHQEIAGEHREIGEEHQHVAGVHQEIAGEHQEIAGGHLVTDIVQQLILYSNIVLLYDRLLAVFV